jgi:hypothetical protein
MLLLLAAAAPRWLILARSLRMSTSEQSAAGDKLAATRVKGGAACNFCLIVTDVERVVQNDNQ